MSKSTYILPPRVNEADSAVSWKQAKRRLGTSGRAAVYLELLQSPGPTSIRKLAKAAEVTQAGLYQILDFLEDEGLVQVNVVAEQKQIQVVRGLNDLGPQSLHKTVFYFVVHASGVFEDEDSLPPGAPEAAVDLYRVLHSIPDGEVLRLKDVGNYQRVHAGLRYLLRVGAVVTSTVGGVTCVAVFPYQERLADAPAEDREEALRPVLQLAQTAAEAKAALLTDAKRLVALYLKVYRAARRADAPGNEYSLVHIALRILSTTSLRKAAARLVMFIITPRYFEGLDDVIERYGTTLLTFEKQLGTINEVFNALNSDWHRTPRSEPVYMICLRRVDIDADIVKEACGGKDTGTAELREAA